MGSGNQWFSWIHLNDLIEAFVFVLTRPDIAGPLNICSPMPMRNRDFARSLGETLQRPSFMKAPGFMIKLVLGEFGTVLLNGQKTVPRRLLDNGFVFQYAEIEKALNNLLSL